MFSILSSLFELIISLIMAGCQFIGSAILFVVLFIIFILTGFVTTSLLIEQMKNPYRVFKEVKENDNE